jgi:hypothetical protein
MDRWIELGRLYRRVLSTAPDFQTALGELQSGEVPEFRRLLDNGTDWAAARAVVLETDRKFLLDWFGDIPACDLGRGIDIIYVELGIAPRTFEISAWRWADRIMLIDDGLIEPDSVRTVSTPGRVHRADELSAGLSHFQSGGEFANLAVWLLFCSFAPLEAYARTNLQASWGIDREFAVLFACQDHVFHGGFVTPSGWKRPLTIVQAPTH